MENKSIGSIIKGLLKMVRPFTMIMTVAIVIGTLGHLLATFITVIGIMVLAGYLSLKQATFMIIAFALLRGIFRYIEQACNHYIAFKVLAHVRHIMYEKLRELAPAKLDNQDRGNLIAMITNDTEMLEVFFAHTISPIVIAVIYSLIMILVIHHYSPLLAGVAILGYVIMAIIIPIITYRLSYQTGLAYRQRQGELNSYVLESLIGKNEILQYHHTDQQMKDMQKRHHLMQEDNKKLNHHRTIQTNLSEGLIIVMTTMAIIVSYMLMVNHADMAYVVAVIAISGSFGPTVAIASLANNLNQVIPCAKRILSLLDEQPIVEEIVDGQKDIEFPITFQNVDFRYPKSDRYVLQDFYQTFEYGKVYGLFGPSGCGKSTLLKLLMRIYRSSGDILFNQTSIHDINSESLKHAMTYVDQECFMFHDTLFNNVTLLNETYSQEDVEDACRLANIHDFIMSLPDGYQTVFEDNLSGGQIQRIGLARAFIQKSPILLLDEPTSNVDSLNEALILESIEKIKKDKLVILVTHRPSSLSVCDYIIKMNQESS